MPHSLSAEHLDAVLSLQLALAWAGETPGGDQPRLGFWNTDLVDAEAGGDLWARLLPRTQRWAGLGAARQAARLVDQHARKPHGSADSLRTLFHFGFELDEALDERFAQHKLEGRPPEQVLPVLAVLGAPFDRGPFLRTIRSDALDVGFKITPIGRQLRAIDGEDVPTQARRLACALLIDPPRQYPLAFILTEAPRGER